MNRYKAEQQINSRYTFDQLNAQSHIQSAESLNEIAQFTVRDRFAQAAMDAIIRVYDRSGFQPSAPDQIAERAYLYADAMLKAREK
ncbi:MAG: hypothetical protein [Siphoviridae sp. ctdc_1]|nr:MAG: hypothetical protein [Siphoviridae sp. ctdc_1]